MNTSGLIKEARLILEAASGMHGEIAQKLSDEWAVMAAKAVDVEALTMALINAQRAINSMKVEAETAAQGDEQMMLEACETISNEGLQADTAIREALRQRGLSD